MAMDVIKTASRVFEVLEYLDEVERPVRLSELVGRFGYPQSSIAALLRSLVKMGYLHHDRPTRSYTPTTRVSRLGAWVNDRLYGEDNTIQLLNKVCQEVEETVVLGVQNDLATQYVLVTISARPVCYYTKNGALRPLCQSGVGWVLLAAMSDDQVRKLVRRHNLSPEFGSQRVDAAELLSSLQRVRREGYAFSRHTVTRGVGMIAMQLPVGSGGALRAVGVGGPVDRLQEKRESILASLRRGIDKFLVPVPAPRPLQTTIVRGGKVLPVSKKRPVPAKPASGAAPRAARK